MRRKKLYAVIGILAALSLIAAACGDDDSGDTAAPAPAPPPEPVVLNDEYFRTPLDCDVNSSTDDLVAYTPPAADGATTRSTSCR